MSEYFRFGAKQEPNKRIKEQDSQKLMREFLASGGKINEIATGKSIESEGKFIIGGDGALINTKTNEIKKGAKKQKGRAKLRKSCSEFLSKFNK